MVEMDEAGEPEIAVAFELTQQMCQRDRIRSARHRRQHPRPARDEIVLRDETAHSLNHRGRVGQVGQIGLVGRTGKVRNGAADLRGPPDLPDPPGLYLMPEDGLEPSTPRL